MPHMRNQAIEPVIFSLWPGVAVWKTASLPLAYVPAIHVFEAAVFARTWMPGTRPGMTCSEVAQRYRRSTAMVRLAKLRRSAITLTK
jgi:hypothetical protein